MSKLDSSNILWKDNTLNELKSLLGDEVDFIFEDDGEISKLGFPWPINVEEIETFTDDQGDTWISIIISFSAVDAAIKYEVRFSIVSRTVSIYPISGWYLNGTDETINSTNNVQFTANSNNKKTTAVFPLVVEQDWNSITLNLTVERPSVNADGFNVALCDSTLYPFSYQGNDGSAVGFYNSGGASGASMTTTERYYCAYSESMYTPTGNEGPTIRFDDGVTKTRINTLNANTWRPTAVGTHDYVVSWTRTGTNSASMDVLFDGSLIISTGAAWVPSNGVLIISASTGSVYNAHTISNVSGLIEY